MDSSIVGVRRLLLVTCAAAVLAGCNGSLVD